MIPLQQVFNDIALEVKWQQMHPEQIRIFSKPYDLLVQEAALVVVKAMNPPATVEELVVIHHGRESVEGA